MEEVEKKRPRKEEFEEHEPDAKRSTQKELDAAIEPAKDTLADEENLQHSNDQQKGSDEMEASIQHVRSKVKAFGTQVSSILDAGKAAFTEAHNAWEEKILHLHQQQVEAWEEDIEILRSIDGLSENISCRLHYAQNVISCVCPTALPSEDGHHEE